MKNIIIIPSRMASTRFPDKPLAIIGGIPMIQRVWQQAITANIGDVFVACSEKEVFDLIVSIGGKAIMTSPEIPTGTDRIFTAIKNHPKKEEYDYIINLQGDMPLINPKDIEKVVIPLTQGFDIGTLVTNIADDEEADVNITKAKVEWIKKNSLGKAIDFYKTSKKILDNIYHHVGIYSFRYSSLRKFVELNQTENERIHKLEQLRALDSQMTIGAYFVNNAPISVDTINDLIKAEEIIKSYQNH